VRDAARTGDDTTVRSALVLVWTTQHLDNLWRLESHLGLSAAEARAEPTDGGAIRMLGRLRARV
jgi:hypothetical protein